jgi:hypothetical protein
MGGIAGVLIYVNPHADEKTKNAANALVAALNDEKITANLRKKTTLTQRTPYSLT